jgi:hypothetical protein
MLLEVDLAVVAHFALGLRLLELAFAASHVPDVGVLVSLEFDEAGGARLQIGETALERLVERVGSTWLLSCMLQQFQSLCGL